MVGEILKFELPEAGIWIPEIKNQQSIQKRLQNGYIQDCLEEKKKPVHNTNGNAMICKNLKMVEVLMNIFYLVFL